jgi:molybdate transport system regulatory protein
MPDISPPLPRLSVRIDLPGGARFGPGMARLMQAIETQGSIRAAAAAMRMSYPKALKLVDSMNAAFSDPLVETRHGGANRGGARLTASGAGILQLYLALCESAHSVNQDRLDLLRSRLAGPED